MSTTDPEVPREPPDEGDVPAPDTEQDQQDEQGEHDGQDDREGDERGNEDDVVPGAEGTPEAEEDPHYFEETQRVTG